MSTLRSPYELLAEHMSAETVERIKHIDDPVLFYARMSQLLAGTIFEAIQVGLQASNPNSDQPGPAEVAEAYNAGYAARRDEEK